MTDNRKTTMTKYECDRRHSMVHAISTATLGITTLLFVAVGWNIVQSGVAANTAMKVSVDLEVQRQKVQDNWESHARQLEGIRSGMKATEARMGETDKEILAEVKDTRNMLIRVLENRREPTPTSMSPSRAPMKKGT